MVLDPPCYDWQDVRRDTKIFYENKAYIFLVHDVIIRSASYTNTNKSTRKVSVTYCNTWKWHVAGRNLMRIFSLFNEQVVTYEGGYEVIHECKDDAHKQKN